MTSAYSDIYLFKSAGLTGKDVGDLTWFGDRNSWLLSFMYMLSPSNCEQKKERNKHCMQEEVFFKKKKKGGGSVKEVLKRKSSLRVA